ncbi:uncharacterized protein K02A2.6-like [Uranotaenia lowii]|uniref:uncharacterized protein K02A2.6-like n=1 Tax=Uranotaenia lowii TaxID=190385 RepID=UPI00247B116F|nr:uncharacterized protein K02A2.6-like [Uranotaenia lowii]
MLRTDIIEPVEGAPEWISPMVVVPKDRNDIRLCINMKYPNQAIQRKHFPLPIIETFLNSLRGATVFSRLDISSAFHHVELHPESRNVTTFMTNKGLMRFKRLMFGITCAPEIFQRIMMEMLGHVKGVIVYIDDIVVSGKSRHEHDQHLNQVLKILEKNNAKLNENKCCFAVHELEILGFKREALAVVWAVEKLYIYLFGLHFTIYTDHKTLEFIFGGRLKENKRAISRAEGWALRLQPYDFEIKHIPGLANISDALSRLCIQTDPPFDEGSTHFLFAIGEGLTAITLDQIKTETGNDETSMAVMEAIKTGVWPRTLIRYEALAKELGILEGILVRDDRIILPKSLRPRALDIAHRCHPWSSYHASISSRKSMVAIQQCAGCAAVSRQSPPEPMSRKEMPDRPMQEIVIDFFSAKECATFLIVVDYYSRYLKVIEMRSTTASKTIEALEVIFNEQTYPETIRSDNGPPFSSAEFAKYCKDKNIRLVRIIPYWPQMNGLVERQNQGILRTLRIAKATNMDWRKAIKD